MEEQKFDFCIKYVNNLDVCTRQLLLKTFCAKIPKHLISDHADGVRIILSNHPTYKPINSIIIHEIYCFIKTNLKI